MGENMNRKIILKGAGILLIAATLILSTVAAAANTKHTIKESQSVAVPFGVLLSEGFEDGVMPPPGGWSTINTNPTWNWEIVDAATYPDFVHSGDYAGWVNYDYVAQSDEWLISPDANIRRSNN